MVLYGLSHLQECCGDIDDTTGKYGIGSQVILIFIGTEGEDPFFLSRLKRTKTRGVSIRDNDIASLLNESMAACLAAPTSSQLPM